MKEQAICKHCEREIIYIFDTWKHTDTKSQWCIALIAEPEEEGNEQSLFWKL